MLVVLGLVRLSLNRPSKRQWRRTHDALRHIVRYDAVDSHVRVNGHRYAQREVCCPQDDALPCAGIWTRAWTVSAFAKCYLLFCHEKPVRVAIGTSGHKKAPTTEQ